MKYAETFGEQPAGEVEVCLGKTEGKTPQGHSIFPAEERVNGKTVKTGKVLYFRGNSIDELEFEAVGKDGFARVTNAGITGAWLWLKGKNSIDTTGYSLK